jgi:glycosyltransferase involved in cell wall biosynthesis
VEDLNHRIVFVAGGIQLGGATTFLLNLGGELVRRGVAVLVVSLEYDNPYRDDFASRGLSLHVEDERTTIFEDRLASALQVVRGFKPTAVISCLDSTSFEILRYVPPGLRRIGMVQSDDPVVYRMVQKYAGCMDGIAAVSAAIAQRLEKIDGLDSVPKHYLPYGVAMPTEPSTRVRPGQPLRILYLGRVANEQKRVHLFPKILARLQEAGMPFRWTIVGDGPDRDSLQRVMHSNRTDQIVKFSGAIAYSQVPQVLEQHDIFLLTSDYEGLPLSLLEAMGHSVVPVVSDLPSGMREVVDESNGVLVPVEDVNGYANAIIFLNEHREELVAKANAASERVRSMYSVEAMTDRWLSVLKPLEKPVPWPLDLDVRGPMTDRRQWKYAPVARFFRRLLKRLEIASIFRRLLSSR